MAGDWIKMRGNLWDDPRVARLCDLTDQGEAAVIGALYWLWATADQHTEDGVMPGLTLRQIDRKTGVAGFGQALCDVGWLADHPEGVRIVKFEEHNGSSAKRRCTEAQRKANSRSMSASDADTKRTDGGQDEDEIRRIAELEKRREEKKETPPNPRKRGNDVPPGFARFWEAWPASTRKAAKAQCLRRWERKGLEELADRIVAAVEASKGSPDWLKDDGAFIVAPLVWLNQARWEAVEALPAKAPVTASLDEERERQRRQAAIAVPCPPDLLARVRGVVKVAG